MGFFFYRRLSFLQFNHFWIVYFLTQNKQLLISQKNHEKPVCAKTNNQIKKEIFFCLYSRNYAKNY